VNAYLKKGINWIILTLDAIKCINLKKGIARKINEYQKAR
jgi:hypothetical protein